MLSAKRLLTAMAGFAILALPAGAFGQDYRDYPNHHHGWQQRAWHDHGNHRGWFKHNPDYWNGGQTWNGGNRVCDADGDDCRWAPNGRSAYMNQPYRPYAYPGYANNGGAPCNYAEDEMPAYYAAMPPSSMNLVGQRDWLIARRQKLMRQIAQLRARGDSKGAARLVSMIQPINAHVRSINRRLGYGPNATPYPPAMASALNVPYGYAQPLSNPYYNDPYAANSAYYGNQPYYGNSTLANVTNALVPMLGYIH